MATNRSFQTNRTPESSGYLVTRDEPQLLFLSDSPMSHGSDTLHPVTHHLPLSRMQNKAARLDKRPTGNVSPPVSSGSIRNKFQREAPRKRPADVFKPLQTAKPFTNKMTTGCISAFIIALFYKYTIPSVNLGTGKKLPKSFCVLRGVN